MSNYLEISDEGAATSSAGQLAELGSRLNDASTPPAVEWGDDDFGNRMRTQYYEKNIVIDALTEKGTLGGRLGELGNGTVAAVTEASNQELVNVLDLNKVQTPEV